MPLKNGGSKAIVSANIRKEIAAGKEVKRVLLSPKGFWRAANEHPQLFLREVTKPVPHGFLARIGEVEVYLSPDGLDDLPEDLK